MCFFCEQRKEISGPPTSIPLLKNKIQPSESEDLTGFIKGLMNWAAFHLTTGRVLPGAVQNGGFLFAEGGWDYEIKSGFLQARTPSLRGSQEISSDRLLNQCGSENFKLMSLKFTPRRG